jgi:outer membrane scaffolding protein for murein synthesis (MipA/OmpV family)
MTSHHKIAWIDERSLMKSRSLCLTALATAATLLSAQAHAQAFGFYRSPVTPGLKQGGSVGLAMLGTREYLGSNESRSLIVPTFDYQWANGVFAGVGNGVGINLSKRADAAYGLRLTADFGRDDKRSSVLAGMGDIHARPEIGGFANWRLTDDLSLASSIRYGSGNDRQGLVVDVGLNVSTTLTPAWRLNAGVATAWANRAYQQSFFGVSAVQALNTGYTAFTPSAGLRDIRIGVALSYALAPSWTVTGGLSLTRLLGDARNSPIVRETSALSGAVSASYRF